MLGIDRGKAPCHATYHYVFQSIAAGDLERSLRGLVPAGPLGHIAIDGKSVICRRGAMFMYGLMAFICRPAWSPRPNVCSY